MTTSHSLRFIVAISILFIFSSCQPDLFFEENKTLGEEGWTYDNKLDYTIAIDDTLQLYNIYLNINHSTEYAYQNIYLMIHTKYPSGKIVSEQLPIDFADKTGQWHGKCNKENCQLGVNLQKDAFFNTPGSYTITIEQYMRIDSLPGISDITLMLEDTGKQRS